jgi:hypothetical protein
VGQGPHRAGRDEGRRGPGGDHGTAGKTGNREWVNGGFHAGHACPRCFYESPYVNGRTEDDGTFRVKGRNADGTHSHECPACRARGVVTRWRH